MNQADVHPQPDYLGHFGLSREPFAAAPDEAFFCADSTLTQRLDMLQNLTEFGMLLLLVIGPPGVGKTTVLQQFLRRAGSNWQVCHLQADALGNTHELVQDLAAGFGIPGEDLMQLKRHLDQLRSQGQLAVLVVDDAERLPDAMLRTMLELSGSAGESDKRLRLVLFGTEQLQDKLAALSPEQVENTHVITIPPLSELQTAAYLHHRLNVAGLSQEAPFTSAQVKAIAKAARGVPAQINARARQMLSDIHGVYSGRRTHVRAVANTSNTGNSRRWAVLAAASVGVVLIAIALWPDSSTQDADRAVAVTDVPPVPEKTVELALPTVATPPKAPTAAGSPVEPAETLAPTAPLPMPTLGPEVQRPAETSPRGKIEVSTLPAPESALPATTAPAFSGATQPEAGLVPSESTFTPPPLTPPAGGAEPSPVPAPAAALPAQTIVKAQPTPKPPASAESVVKPAPKPPAIEPPANVANRPTPQLDTSWLKTRDKNAFTLQVLGSRRETAIRQFIKDQGLKGQMAILRTERQGQGWYVLLYGDYPSRAAANAAVAQLPAMVRAGKPWPRSFASVQADIAKNP